MPHRPRHGADFDLLASGPNVVLLGGGERRTPRHPQTLHRKQNEQRERDQLRAANDDVLTEKFDQTR
jgi:hypothetical protein